MSTDVANEAARLEAEHARAAEAERETERQARAAQERAAAIEAELAAEAAADPGAFSTAKGEGRKLAEELEELRSPTPSWSKRIAASRRRTTAAHRAVMMHRSANLEALCFALEPEAREAAAAIEDALRAVVEAVARRGAVEQEFTSLLASEAALVAHLEIPAADELGQLRKLAARLLEQGIEAPLPRSVFGLPGARKVRSKDGGWVSPENLLEGEYQERKQAERLARKARQQERGAA
ncbi:MAG: hypothetical protein M3433_02645 [Actinomycetota bacterium]|nr:hypothetical protein [Actinomycetota bacterium]